MTRKMAGRAAAVLPLLVAGAAAARAEIVWRGNFEGGTILSQWDYKPKAQFMTIVDEPVREGQHALRIDMSPAARTNRGMDRVEVQHKLDPASTVEGSDRYYAWSVYAPKPLSEDLHQIGYFETEKSWRQIMAVEVRGEKVSFVTRVHGIVHWEGPGKLTAGRWHDVVVHVRWSRDPARGLVEVWWNGDKQVNRVTEATLPDGNTPFFQTGLLRVDSTGDETLFLDSAIEATTLDDVVPPPAVRAPGQLRRNIEFAAPGGESLKLDAFVPKGKGPFPAAVIVHGGGHIRGDKNSYVRPLFELLAGAGIAWFSIDYRLAPAHKIAAQLQDVESGLAWVRAHARELKIDPRRVALVGESAGGYLTSLVGTRLTGAAAPAAVVVFYAMHEVKAPAPGEGTRKGFLFDMIGANGGQSPGALAEMARAYSPVEQVRKDLPPYLLICSDDDGAYKQSVRMSECLKEAGATHEFFTTHGLGHGMGKWKDVPAEHERLLAWVTKVLKTAPPTTRR